jgi:phage terminase large subunit-like protein
MSSALDLLAALVLEDGRRWGEAAVPVQWDDARAVLDQDSPTPFHWLGRARGYSKTTDLAGMAVAAMLAQAPDRSREYGLAADQQQGTLLIDSIAGIASRTPELRGAIVVQESKIIAQRSGTTLTILPADSATVWGLRPWLAIVDELTQWHDSARSRRVWEGLTSGLAKVAGSRLAVICTAGDPSHWSKAIYDQALDDPLWRVRDVAGPPPWLSPERLAGEKRRLPPSSYARLFENVWTSGEDRLSSDEDLAACVDAEAAHDTPKAGMRYIVAIDLGVKHDRTAVVVAHAERVPGAVLPRVVVDRLRVWKPSRLRPVRLSEVQDYIGHIAKRYHRATCVFDPSQGLSMMQALKREGLTVREFTFSASSVGKLATTLVQLVGERALALPPDEDLLDELRNVRLRETSVGIVRLDHDRNRHDDRVIALGIAAVTVVERDNARPARGRSLLLEGGYRPRSSFNQREKIRPAADGRGGDVRELFR